MEAKREGAAFVGVWKLNNGGVVFDCKDEVMASWLKQQEIIPQFIAKMGGVCVYKPRRVELVAEMIPVGARIEEGGMWRQVERDSGLEAGVIVGARWLKALACRRAGQQSAHVKVEFVTAEAADHAIDNGLYWQGKHTRACKSEEEVWRCVKCQKFDGHLAFACKSAADVCGRCVEAHWTLDSLVTDSGPMWCSNCKVGGHGAASRTCPFFQSERQKKNEWDPTYGYHYIPTTDPRMWATTAGTAAAAAATAASSAGHG
ncbi:hypothetical protein DFH08DRAFT_712487 [Mycena albidolilacea]|uniref:Uncharacterized protein n=1 Tax=Mycena albidolilacea TaxID=1033008 RepID=A0AAD7EHJ8_9AGAR|nr:hypothetical protein DFH08DRAFT_712487 [Mycena albidolilacea]